MPLIAASKRSGRPFVTRVGRKLFLGTNEFRFGACNIYWLGLSITTTWSPGATYVYPSAHKIDDGYATARALGCQVVRAYACMPSIGASMSAFPTAGTLNESTMRSIDLAIARAADYGIYLVIPLCDPYGYYVGSTSTWSTAYGGTGSDFFTNSTVINGFKSCLTQFLNRVNTVNGLRYGDDPTIMAWETGNEIGPSTSWTLAIADHLKSLAPRTLVMDGGYGINTALSDSDAVDIVSDHYYPLSVSKLITTGGKAVGFANKVYFTCEYDWNNVRGGDTLANFLAKLYEYRFAQPGQGWWNLAAHADTYGWAQDANNYAGQDNGAYDQLFGNGTNQSKITTLRQFAYDFAGSTAPPWPTPGVSKLIATSATAIAWRGVAGAACYQVERSSVSASAGFFRIASGLLDSQTPWTDPSPPSSPRWYRVRAVNQDGVAGCPSNTIQL